MANTQLEKPYVASTYENDAIQILVKNIVAAVNEHQGSYDRTFKSIVVGTSNGKYRILDESGTERLVKSAIPNYSIKAGTSVWVKIPSGNINQIHICGINN